MNEAPNPELRALAARLFAAGRAERPGTALGRRLSLLEPQQAGLRVLARDQSAPVIPKRFRRAASGLARWSAAALVLACVGGVWHELQREVAPITISPDRSPATLSSRASEPAPPAQAQPRLEAAARTSSETTSEPAHKAAVQRARPARQRAAEAPRPATIAGGAAVPSASAATVAAAPESASSSSQLLSELDLLKRARAALRAGSGAQALALLERHAREHTGSSLEAEATVLRIETLAALGRRGDASDLAARFVRANPNSALGDRAKTFIQTAAPAP